MEQQELIQSNVTIRRRPGRPHKPGHMTYDKISGAFGIFVNECAYCHTPNIIAPADFQSLLQYGVQRRKTFTRRLLRYILDVKSI